ncbi:MAG: alpha/beta hydrolase [Rhizobiales bacterium TMED94]|nr:hypothetical protein [Rhodobiaceae bacterium]RPF85845.1 MAG: alpha/beta hydrolase [Rhizobiales bacterium TMED94]
MVNWFIYIFFVFFLMLVFVYFFYNRETTDINDLEIDIEYSFFNNNNGRTAYYSIGEDSSESLILIHGVTVPSHYYKKIATSLSEIGYKVYVYDHFGRGFSDRPKIKYNMYTYQNQLNDFINHLSIDNVTLMGVSMGGALASNYTAKNPTKVKALILNVPFVGLQTIGLETFASIPIFWDFYLRFFIIKRLVERGYDLTDDSQGPDHFIEQFNVTGTQNSLSSLMKNFTKHDFYNDYKLINDYKIPVHITYAIDDEDVPVDSILKAIELVPEATTFSFEGGHNIINSRTKEIVSLINDFKSKYLND